MKKLTIFLGFIFLTLIFGCIENQKEAFDNKFILNGELEGIENGTWINLILDGKILDSTQILENKFSISGELEHPKKFNLHIQKTRNFTSIWLESKTINFKAKNGEFNKAIITGSKTQEEQENLNSMLKNYRSLRDSLTTIYRNPKSNDSIKKIAREGLDIIYKNHLKLEQKFIKNNTESYASAFLVDFYTSTLGTKKTKELYNILSDSLKTSSYGKSIINYLSLNKNLKIGDKYVDFSMVNDKGKMINLSDYEGKLFLLDFWASWCGPCIEEFPALKKAYLKFKDDGFEIVSVSQDKFRESWINSISSNQLNWVNLWEKGGNKSEPHLIYGIKGIPDNFLIDKNGIIIARRLKGDDLILAIEKELGEKASR